MSENISYPSSLIYIDQQKCSQSIKQYSQYIIDYYPNWYEITPSSKIYELTDLNLHQGVSYNVDTISSFTINGEPAFQNIKADSIIYRFQETNYDIKSNFFITVPSTRSAYYSTYNWTDNTFVWKKQNSFLSNLGRQYNFNVDAVTARRFIYNELLDNSTNIININIKSPTVSSNMYVKDKDGIAMNEYHPYQYYFFLKKENDYEEMIIDTSASIIKTITNNQPTKQSNVIRIHSLTSLPSNLQICII